MGFGLKVAQMNGKKYELHSQSPIPKMVIDWCSSTGIKCIEWQ
jgi:hypothetical protein